MTVSKTNTLFLDIDGCILSQAVAFIDIIKNPSLQTSIGPVAESLMAWHCAGHKIILTTGRPEPLRKITEEALLREGIVYDQLVMDCGSGIRILINNKSDIGVDRAVAVNVETDKSHKFFEEGIKEYA